MNCKTRRLEAICGITRNCFTFRSEFSRHPTSGRVFIMNASVLTRVYPGVSSTQRELVMDLIKYYTTKRLIRDLLSNTPNWYVRASEFRGYLFTGNA